MAASDPKQTFAKSGMVLQLRNRQAQKFKAFRAIESVVFGLPVAVAFFYDAIVFFSTLAISMLFYVAWTNWLKRRQSREDNEAYDAVYETEQSKRLGFQPIEIEIPWSMWLVWLAAVVIPLLYAAIL